ncbi:MAG: Zn-dependent hydrolase [Bdellovibrio sp.]|nr:MAG: Zn-dependent hydrolase [Bdellovibrio sp.]
MKVFLPLIFSFALTTPVHALSIDGARLNGTLQKLAEFGKNPKGGVSRVAYSEADKNGREYVLSLMKQAGLATSVDTAGNLIGIRNGSKPDLKPIIIGSHIDSVPEGGNYDGIVGSLSAIEVAQTLQDHNRFLRHTLKVIVFQNEEGGHLGSRAVTSGLTPDDLALTSLSGKKIGEGIGFIGGDPDRLEQGKIAKGDFAAYIELHIEQGGVLEAEKAIIGVVEGIVGIRRWNVTVTGVPNHAGTTPMRMRRDAMVGAAEFISGIHKLILKTHGRQVGTVGKIDAEPGAPNVIPGKVRFTFEVRDLDSKKLEKLYQDALSLAHRIEKENGTAFDFKETYNTAPVLTDDFIKSQIKAAARNRSFRTLGLPSGAGHDAQEFARLGPMGMIFIPSRNGVSHSPEEFSSPEEVADGAQVLFDAVELVDQR